MTVSTADIPVLHFVEVAHLYPQVVLPICQGIVTSHSSPPRRRGKIPLQGLYKVPLASENLLRFEKGNIGIPRPKSHRSMIDLRTSLYAAPLPLLPLSGKVVFH
jgi:hypothetical protein